jgi:hypothetical protein
MPREASRSGYNYSTLKFNMPVASGTDAQEWVTDLILGFRYEIVSAFAVVQVAATGSSETRLFRVLKGASTVCASKTIAHADAGTIGGVITLTPVASRDDRTFGDADALSVDSPAADSVSFTAGTFQLSIVIRSRAQQIA